MPGWPGRHRRALARTDGAATRPRSRGVGSRTGRVGCRPGTGRPRSLRSRRGWARSGRTCRRPRGVAARRCRSLARRWAGAGLRATARRRGESAARRRTAGAGSVRPVRGRADGPCRSPFPRRGIARRRGALGRRPRLAGPVVSAAGPRRRVRGALVV
ncbi:Uncharacterised protein [Clostridioides difficile]|nr:Uncharacterised protein [Clostridioides difficile]